MLSGILLTSGKHYYEIEVAALGGGASQIGWADLEYVGASRDGVGVGDDKHSWAMDGDRELKWHGGLPQSRRWEVAW